MKRGEAWKTKWRKRYTPAISISTSTLYIYWKTLTMETVKEFPVTNLTTN